MTEEVAVATHLYRPFADPRARAAKMVARYRLNEDERALLDRTIAAIPADTLAIFRTGYRARFRAFTGHDPVKYADLAYWLAQKIRVAVGIGLDRRPPLDILDIGTGGGHFPAVLAAIGHRVIGIDVEMPLYQRIADVLGVDRRISPVMALERLPDFGRRFDAVTIHWPAFDVHLRELSPQWSLDEWLFLLRDIVQQQLRPGGLLHLWLNRHPASGAPEFPAHLIAWSIAHGATGDVARGELRFEAVTPELFADLPARDGVIARFLARIGKAR